MTQPDHWHTHARQWQHVGPPLRPCAEDIRLLEQIVSSHRMSSGADINALLLGVTPEIATMCWPQDAQLTAVDRNPGMIHEIWPGFPTLGEGVTCGDWLQLPFTDARFNTVVGDGCFTLLPYPDGYRGLLASVHRVLATQGIFVMRYFLRPEASETSEQVFADLRAGHIGNFHVFKWRLAQALHGSIEEGVRLADIWNAWQHQGFDTDRLAKELGWAAESIRTIDAYRDVDTYYTFPTLAEMHALTSDRFTETGVHYGDYELGERCPTVTYCV